MSDLIRFSQSRMIETRSSPSAIASPVEFYQPNQGLRPKWDADRFVKNGYLEQTYVFSCVDKKASTLARVPYRAGSDPDNPTSFRKNAKLATLLGQGGKPAPGWTPRMWWKYIFSQFFIMGKFACLIERNALGEIVALWPLQAQHLFPIPDTGPNPKGYFAGFTYGNPGAPGYIKFISADKIMYCFEPSPDDPRQPLSVLDAASLDISVAQLINEYDFALLQNNSVPATIITTEPFADNDMRKRFRNQFLAKFGGPRNAGKTMFLEADPDENPDGTKSNNVAGKIHVERLALSSQEMQSPEKRAATINDICVAFKTPLSILGDSTRSKFTNMESDYRNWWADTELPAGDYVCDLINVALAPMVDNGRYQGWFDFSGIGALKEAPRFSLTDLVAARQAGDIDRDELRREIGLAPWDDVDHPEVHDIIAEDNPNTPDPLALAKAQAQQPEISAGPAKDAVPPALSKALTSAVRHSLTMQRDAMKQRANGHRGTGGVVTLFDAEYWHKRTTDDLKPIFTGIAEYRAFPVNFVDDVALNITKDSRYLLDSRLSVDMAYADIEQRSSAVSQTVLRMLEEIPADHLIVVLEAIKNGKMTPAQALKVIE